MKTKAFERERKIRPEESIEVNRRSFLGATVASAFLWILPTANAKIERASVASLLEDNDAASEENHLERMRRELHKAMKKPIEQRKWVMVIDLQKCIGCKACTVACVAENHLPPGVVYRPVVEEEIGEFPNVRKRYTPRPCMHCEEPPCVPVCPVAATYTRPDGIVAVDYDACIGCRYCLTACPYNARTADFGEFYGLGHGDESESTLGQRALAYETQSNNEYGKSRQRIPGKENSPIGNARKCQFCVHLIEQGILPACVSTCLGGATYFGDYRDRESLVRKLIGDSRMMRLKEELGTEPKVFYLI